MYLSQSESSALPQWKALRVVKQVTHRSSWGMRTYPSLLLAGWICSSIETLSIYLLSCQFMDFTSAPEGTWLIVTVVSDDKCWVLHLFFTLPSMCSNWFSCCCDKNTWKKKKQFKGENTCSGLQFEGIPSIIVEKAWWQVQETSWWHCAYRQEEGSKECWYIARFLLFMQSRAQAQGMVKSTIGVCLCISIKLI